MAFAINISKRVRKRTTRSGLIVHHTRYVLSYRDPFSRKRRQEFFERARDAELRRQQLIVKVGTGAYIDERNAPTIAEAVDHWLADRKAKVKSSTLAGYTVIVAHIRGPVLTGTQREKAEFAKTGKAPKGTTILHMLGHLKISALRTADIRAWHRLVTEHAGVYTANRAKAHLKSILALAEEDFGIRAPAMPTGLPRQRGKAKKTILSPEDIARVVEAAKTDEHGLYFAFAFLTGTRISEQLGLLWEDVDFESNVIRIQRIQERDGSLTNMTKTEAGTREVPMGPTLREMLMAWRLRCPRHKGQLHRVFPGPGRPQAWPKPRIGGGGPLLYQNFRRRYWEPAFAKLGLPYVTPHSARHSYISTMQAQGIEVGLVAKLAGHANPSVTLCFYTQATRGGEAAVAALEQAYQATG